MAQNTNSRSTSSRSSSSSRSTGSRSTGTRSRSTSARTGGATAKRKTAATRRSTAAKRGVTRSNARTAQRNTRRAGARAQTDVAREAAAARRDAERTLDKVGDAAERTFLTYVGATLTARDKVAELVGTYSDPTKLQREIKQRRTRVTRRLKGFERRGTTARNRVEKDVRTLRTDAARFGRDAERTSVAQGVSLVGAVAENAAQGAALAATKAAREVTGRVAQLV